jgi:hypothetical protein
MSKYEQRDNTGSLFKNLNKEKDTHADYRGECLIDGVAYYMDCWLKTADSGRKWMSFSFKPKARPKDEAWQAGSQRQERKPSQPSRATGFDDMDSDPPF